LKRWYIFRWIKVHIRKHPIISLSALIAIIISSFFFLKQFSWGDEIINVFFAIMSTEAVVLRLKEQEKAIQEIIIWLLITDAVNITIDIIIVFSLLKWNLFTSIIRIFSSWLRALVHEVKKLIKGQNVELNDFNPLHKINTRLNGIKNKPSKVGLLTIYFLGVWPRFPPWPGVPGGVSIGVLVIKYNTYGYKAWITLGCGIITRHAVTIGSIYGISSIF